MLQRLFLFLKHPFAQIVVLYALYMGSRRQLWGALTRVPGEVYEGISPFLGAMVLESHAPVLFGIGLLVALTVRWRWDDLELAPWLRRTMAVVIVLQGWLVFGAHYNLFTDQAYAFDRLLALVLTVLTLWRPAFWPALFAVALIFCGQEDHPIVALNWTERRLFFDIQIAFAVFLLARLVVGARVESLVFLWLLIAGGSYVYPAIVKLQLHPQAPWRWALDGDFGNLFLASHESGFIASMGEVTALRIADVLTTLSPLIGILTLVVEFAGVLLVVNRRVAVLALLSFVGMHAGIFLSSGIFFWKWIACDLALAVLLWRQPAVFQQWPWWLRLLGVVVVLFSQKTLEPPRLGWWDSAVARSYRIEAIDERGVRRVMSPHMFAPFELQVFQSRIAYVHREPTLVGTFGAVTSWSLYHRLQKARVSDVERMLKGRRAPYNAQKTRQFDEMARKIAQTLNRNGGEVPFVLGPKTPPHMVHDVAGKVWNGQPIVRLEVRMRQTLRRRRRNRLDVLFDDVVHTIDVDADKARRLPRLSTRQKSKKSPTSHLPPPRFPLTMEPLRSATPRAPVDRGSDMVFDTPCDATDVITIGLMNDLMFHRPLYQQMERDGVDSIWREVIPWTQAPDLTFANVESTLACCQSVDGEVHPDPGDHFDNNVYTSNGPAGLNLPPSLAAHYKRIGVDVVSTANNHAMDRGAFGVGETLKSVTAAGLAVAGTRTDPKAPWYTITETRGVRLAWLACTEWLNVKKGDSSGVLDCTRHRDLVVAEVRALAQRDDVDGVIFLPSGGVEGRLLPDERLRTVALAGADAGATMVVSYHPHTMQTWEKHRTPDGRDVPLIWNRGNWFTFRDHLEERASTLVFASVGRDKPGEKVRALGVAHVPFAIMREGEQREMRLQKPDGPDAAAYALTVARFGQSRLHPPTLPVEPRLECRPGQTSPTPAPMGVGEICVRDGECEDDLACQALSDGNGVCTRACTVDDDCGEHRCARVEEWNAKACVQRCTNDEDCRLRHVCVSVDGEKACVPH